MQQLRARKYRRALAWLGFVALYLALPLALAAGVYAINAMATV
ncbi:MAG: hypothetical protein Q8P23_01620 [bacterium]|nr:hypothetical protein [bacterium]